MVGLQLYVGINQYDYNNNFWTTRYSPSPGELLLDRVGVKENLLNDKVLSWFTRADRAWLAARNSLFQRDILLRPQDLLMEGGAAVPSIFWSTRSPFGWVRCRNQII